MMKATVLLDTTKKCVGCGQDFTPKRVNQTRCKKGCTRERTKESKRGKLEFICVDGEGVTDTFGMHRYVMLSIDDQTITNPNGLTYTEIFEFLYAYFTEHPRAAYVGYFLGYDFCNWLKGITEHEATKLLTKSGIASRRRSNSGGNPKPFPVYIGENFDWEIDTLNLKRLQFRPGTAPGETNPHKWMTICDAGPFFQQAFVKTLQSWDNPRLTQEMKEIIYEGKARRSTAVLDREMVRYNVAENQALSIVMDQLNEGLQSVGINLSRTQWFGPGQAAQQWLGLINAPTTDEYKDYVPQPVREACIASYYGGWFEIMEHGHVGDGYNYDINSAYPYAISLLPCLRHGKWVNDDIDGYTLLNVDVYGNQDAPIGPMPFRSAKGRILRPHNTAGWYWRHEIDAAHEVGLIDNVVIHEAWTYVPCDCPSPYASIAELYQERIRVGKNSAAGKALKLIYNSAYGKMAQSVGMPKYANGFNASLITSTTRTMILDAMSSHPNGADDVLMVATDGIVFRSPHLTLDVSASELGKWDAGISAGLTLFMPGLYWDNESRARIASNESLVLKSRGVNPTDLAPRIADIDEQFNRGEWATTDIPIRFDMVGLKQALARGKWNTAGIVNQSSIRTIKSDPSNKRQIVGTLSTMPYVNAELTPTAPYSRRFGDDELETDLYSSLDTEDQHAMLALLSG